MAVEWPIPLELFIYGPIAIGGVAALVRLAPRVIGTLGQHAYDRAGEAEAAEWVLRVDPLATDDRHAARRLIAGLHPGLRRGVDAWRRGWPLVTLSIVVDGGPARWVIRAPRQLARAVEASVAGAFPDAELESVEPATWPPAVLSLALRGAAPVAPSRDESGFASALAEFLARLPSGGAARWRLDLRPTANGTSTEGASSLLGQVIRSMLGQPYEPPPPPAARPTPNGGPWFNASVSLDAWLPGAAARAWLFDAAGLVSQLRAAGWDVEASIGGRPRSMLLEPGAVAALWQPPGADDVGRNVDIVRARRLAAPSPMRSGERRIGRDAGRDLLVPADLFLRHAAFIGRTGSGKSTQLLALAADDLAAGRGFTFIDPHGDAVARLLDAVPADQVERVHLLELGERARPRSFNPIELAGADPELVAGQFVDTLADLYPRYSGPKQTHYLRNALLTLLLQSPTATPLDLYDLLVNPERRRELLLGLRDPHLITFWEHEWPIRGRSNREPSVEAVINKLGGFITYPSIRQIVASPHSTIRPRQIMDEGRVLLADLSRVGRDHGRLFGSLLIARYAIDALARQGTPPSDRRPHQLYIDEVHAFDTSSLRAILTETRKFGLGTTVATQYLGRLGDELRNALLSDVGTLALLQPAPDDSHMLARSFEPLTERDLLAQPRFRMAIRTEVGGERAVFTADVLPEPRPLGSAAEVRRLSDARDGHDPV
jgi:hypothetical protein